MYVIKYDSEIYAGTYNDMDGCYLYPSSCFNPLNNQEIEIKNINVVNNVCTINYLMPYCTSSEEYIFQADADKETVIVGFCNAVEARANEMIVMIRECSNIRNLLKKTGLIN